MENAQLIALILGPLFLVTSLSLLIYPNQWVKVIGQFEKNHLALVSDAFLATVIGLIIVNMYNVWAWNVWVIVTATGWILLAKGVFYLLAPGKWIKSVFKHFKCATCVYFSGLICLVAGAALTYYAYLA